MNSVMAVVLETHDAMRRSNVDGRQYLKLIILRMIMMPQNIQKPPASIRNRPNCFCQSSAMYPAS